MFIHPDGSVTGSVNQAVLDAYNEAKAKGGDLSEFAPYLAENTPEAKLAAGAVGVTGQPAPEVPAEEQAPAEADAYEDWTLAELQDEAVARGLPKSGNKAEVADRLRQYDTDEE